ncbi:MAG: NADH-quinone oxidoreductase subunit NuoE [Calditrichia bacterium]|nr:NADH-quinone oxidoreductase subunit NuoE [Calditrichia bacterium]
MEAVLTNEDKKVFEKYSQGEQSAIIPLLQDVQDIYGYLPEEKVIEVAKHCHVTISHIYGVATFYNQFRLNPLGKNLIRVCRGTACHVKGSKQILDRLEQELGIKAGETTKDKMFTIETVACIGACSIAPVITVGEEFHGRLEAKDVPKILKSYRKAAEHEESTTDKAAK